MLLNLGRERERERAIEGEGIERERKKEGENRGTSQGYRGYAQAHTLRNRLVGVHAPEAFDAAEREGLGAAVPVVRGGFGPRRQLAAFKPTTRHRGQATGHHEKQAHAWEVCEVDTRRGLRRKEPTPLL